MPGFRPESVRVHTDVDGAYAALESAAAAGTKPEASIWKAFRNALRRVRQDGQWGEVIPTSRIPAHFRRRYGVANLYCVDLAGFRRAFYTIEGRSVVFLDLVTHAQYDKWFPNKGK